MAKVLLKNLGMPDVALEEFQMLEQRFMRGRCDRGVMTWREMVRLAQIALALLSLTHVIYSALPTGRALNCLILALGGTERV